MRQSSIQEECHKGVDWTLPREKFPVFILLTLRSQGFPLPFYCPKCDAGNAHMVGERSVTQVYPKPEGLVVYEKQIVMF